MNSGTIKRFLPLGIFVVLVGFLGIGLTLPMAAPERYHGLLVMNTTLACGDPLPAGFLAWREMCAKNTEIGRAHV